MRGSPENSLFAVKKGRKEEGKCDVNKLQFKTSSYLERSAALTFCTMSYATFCNMPPGEKTMIATCIVICFDFNFSALRLPHKLVGSGGSLIVV